MKKRKQLPDEALEFFRKQGRIGGRKRAANLTAEERSEQARKAVQARWAQQVKETETTKSPSKKGTK
jgi:hypothetical protein